MKLKSITPGQKLCLCEVFWSMINNQYGIHSNRSDVGITDPLRKSYMNTAHDSIN